MFLAGAQADVEMPDLVDADDLDEQCASEEADGDEDGQYTALKFCGLAVALQVWPMWHHGCSAHDQ